MRILRTIRKLKRPEQITTPPLLCKPASTIPHLVTSYSDVRVKARDIFCDFTCSLRGLRDGRCCRLVVYNVREGTSAQLLPTGQYSRFYSYRR